MGVRAEGRRDVRAIRAETGHPLRVLSEGSPRPAPGLRQVSEGTREGVGAISVFTENPRRGRRCAPAPHTPRWEERGRGAASATAPPAGEPQGRAAGANGRPTALTPEQEPPRAWLSPSVTWRTGPRPSMPHGSGKGAWSKPVESDFASSVASHREQQGWVSLLQITRNPA